MSDPYPPRAEPEAVVDQPLADSALIEEFGLADPENETPPPARRPLVPRRVWRLTAIALGVVLVVLGVVFGPSTWQVMAQRHTTLTPPDRLGGLTLDTTDDARATADYLRTAVAVGISLRTSVGAVYDDPADKQRSVMFFGGTAMVFFPDRELRTAFRLLDDRQDGMRELRSVPAGRYGGLMQCGISTGTGGDMTVCGWADHGSIAVALFPGRTVAEAAPLMRQMRDAIQRR